MRRWAGDGGQGKMHACFGKDCCPVQVLALWWQGHALHGAVGLLDTAAGHAAAELLDKGHSLGTSLRCWTSLQRRNSSDASVVQDDCQLITCAEWAHRHLGPLLLTDLVANRSAQCADQCLLCLLQSGPYNGAGLCILHAAHEPSQRRAVASKPCSALPEGFAVGRPPWAHCCVMKEFCKVPALFALQHCLAEHTYIGAISHSLQPTHYADCKSFIRDTPVLPHH